MDRVGDREPIDLPGRVRLLEGDMDRTEASIDRMRAEFRQALADQRTEVFAKLEGMATQLAGQQRTMVGILVSVVVACIMLAVNLAVHA